VKQFNRKTKATKGSKTFPYIIEKFSIDKIKIMFTDKQLFLLLQKKML